MWVRQGTLTACNFGGAVVSQLTSGYDGTIRIEAKLGGQTKFIELNNDAEIVLSNTSDLFKPKSKNPVPEDDHFRLYGKLDVKRDYAALSTLPGELPARRRRARPTRF